MAILQIQTAPPAGQTAVTSSVSMTQSTLPSIIYILTNDTYATVTATGYLTITKQEGFTYSNNQMALVYTTDEGPVWTKVVITYSGSSILNTVVSLVQISSPGDVILPTIASNIIVSTDTVGTLGNTTNTAVNRGSLQAGLSGTSGSLISYPSTADKGSLSVSAVANAANYSNLLTNASTSAARTWTLPDATGTIALTGSSVASITGTENQVLANGTSGAAQTGAVTLTTPQDIAISSTPQFSSLNIGASTGPQGNAAGLINAVGLNGSGNVIATSYINTSGSAPSYWAYKSRSAVAGSFVAVQNGDEIMRVMGFGDDGAAFRQVAKMDYLVNGAVSSGIVPGLIRFSTANTSGVLTAAMMISDAQIVNLTNALPVTSGGTGLSSTTANQLLYSSATSTIAGLATAANGVLITSAGGVPSISSTMPSGISATNMNLTTPTLGVASATSITLTKANGTEGSNLVTASGAAGVITTSALTTAAAGTYVITWTNTFIDTTSVIQLTQMGGTNTIQPIIMKVVAGNGSAVITLYNDDLINALNGTVLIGYLVV